jgi:YVTN family beta-propeller protein
VSVRRRAVGAIGVAVITTALVGVTAPLAATAATGGGPVTVTKSVATGDGFLYAVAVDSARGLVYFSDDDGEGVHVFNEKTGVTTALDVHNFNISIAVSTKSGDAYIPDQDSDFVTVLRGTKVVGIVHGITGAYDATVDQATGYAYIDEQTADAVAVLKGTTLLATIPVGAHPLGGAADPSDGLVYIPNQEDNTVSVIKGSRVVTTVPVGSSPDYVAVDPGTHTAYVSNNGGDGTVSILHGADHTAAATVATGPQPYGIAVDTATHLAYVADQDNHTVAIIKGNSVIATRPIGPAPTVPAVDPDTGVVIVPSDGTNTMTVLRGTTVVQHLTAPTATEFVAVDSRTSKAFVSERDGHFIQLQTPAPPTITLTRPVSGGKYKRGSAPSARFACNASLNNAVTSCRGTVASGSRVHSALGSHVFTVHARSAYGAEVTKTVHYRVTRKAPGWFHDPVSTSARHAEIRVPSDPARYSNGPLIHTTATYRTRRGTLAVPATSAFGHTLVRGQALAFDHTALFGFDSSRVTPATKVKVRALRTALVDVRAVTCEGYSDIGSDSHHRRVLSRDRAVAICALVHRVRPAITTRIVAYGGTWPVVVGATQRQRAQNRRVVLDITRSKQRSTPATPPQLVKVVAGHGDATITFDRPVSTGGAPVGGYQVSTDGQHTWHRVTVHGSSPFMITISGLANGTRYPVAVRAINAAGYSAASHTLHVTPVAAGGVPGISVLANGAPDYEDSGPSNSDFTFTTPAANGSPITSYQVSVNDGAWTDVVLGEYTPGDPNAAVFTVGYDVTDCPDNATYTYAIRAMNASGYGPRSADISISFTGHNC